jgi:hypothetical protein
MESSQLTWSKSVAGRMSPLTRVGPTPAPTLAGEQLANTWLGQMGTVSGTEWSILLVHPILVGGCLGDDQHDVPVLNDFAVLVEPENVDPGVVMVTRPDLVTVQHDVVVLGQGTPTKVRPSLDPRRQAGNSHLYSKAPG